MRSFHQKRVVPNNCVLAVFGDVKAADVKAAVEKAFASWQKIEGASALPGRISGAVAPLPLPQRVEESRDKKQAVIVLGFAATTLHDADRYALDLLQEACSDLGSRLFLRVREKLGLAYYVGAQHFPGLVPGYFAFYAGTEPTQVSQVEQEFLKEAELLRTEGLTAEELQRAKAKIIGAKKIARQDLGGLAVQTALDELYGLGYQRTELDDAKFESVTLEQVKAVAQKYLKPDAFVVSVVKP